MLRKLLIGLGMLAITGVLLWVYKIEILLAGTSFLIKSRTPDIVQEFEPQWQQGPNHAALPPDQRLPNIVLIVADDLGFNDVSMHQLLNIDAIGMADSTVPTPNIDRLAAQGVMFSQSYATSAVCASSRAAIMTGRYATRFGYEFTPTPKLLPIITNLINRFEPGLYSPVIDFTAVKKSPDIVEAGVDVNELTIADLLKARGYYTAHIGKWHLGQTANFKPQARGFDDSMLKDGGLYLESDDPNVVNVTENLAPVERFAWAIHTYSTTFNGSTLFRPKGYLTDYYTDQAVKVIAQNKNRPFFLYLAHWGVHVPLQSLKSDYDALSHIPEHHHRVYAAMVMALDRSVGRIVQAVEDEGLEENTLVIFTSDNGGAGYINIPSVNQPYRGWKLTLFEGGTHVPFVARFPGHLPAGEIYNEPIGHVDILPTVLAAAGGSLPDDRVYDGVNLLPYLTGDKIGLPHDTLFWRQGYYQAVLHQGWKMQVSDLPDKVWLYDIANDPTEQVNVASQYPDKVAALQKLLDNFNAEQASPQSPSVAAYPVAVDKIGSQQKVPEDEYIYFPN